MSVRAVVITVPVGVGKTTVEALDELLEARGVAHTLINMD